MFSEQKTGRPLTGTDKETSWISTSDLEHATEYVVDFCLPNTDKPGPSFP